jgi:YbgC/YbaW family acyl-CoA thioester hydrolase
MNGLYEQDHRAQVHRYRGDTNDDTAFAPRRWPPYHRSIYIHETDKDGVVHFSNYFKIAEEATFAGFRASGCVFESSQHSVAMLNATANYFHPMTFGDRIDVVLTDLAAQRVKFMLAFEFRGDNGLYMATVQLTLVTIVVEGHKAIPLPLTIKETLANALDDPGRTPSPNKPLANS